LGAEPVPRMPVDQRAGFGQDRRFAAGQQRREAARIDRLAVVAGPDLGWARVDREIRPAAAEAQENQRRAALDRLMPGRKRLPIQLDGVAAPD
jgi:hypothetical protein